MRDIAHLLRPGHLQQLKNILEDPEASKNDKFVALDLLKNAGIAAGGVLPSFERAMGPVGGPWGSWAGSVRVSETSTAVPPTSARAWTVSTCGVVLPA